MFDFLGRKYQRCHVVFLSVTFIAILFLPWARVRGRLIFLLGEAREEREISASKRSTVYAASVHSQIQRKVR